MVGVEILTQTPWEVVEGVVSRVCYYDSKSGGVVCNIAPEDKDDIQTARNFLLRTGQVTLPEFFELMENATNRVSKEYWDRVFNRVPSWPNSTNRDLGLQTTDFSNPSVAQRVNAAARLDVEGPASISWRARLTKVGASILDAVGSLTAIKPSNEIMKRMSHGR